MREYHKTLDKRMFDFEQFYCLVANMLPDFSTIVEVGIANGASAIYLAEVLLNLKKKFKFYLVDNLAYGGREQLAEIIRNVGRAGLHEYVEILVTDSLTAATCYVDDHFDFVFLDSSHRYEQTKAEILTWYPKLKVDGVLAGHDYNDGEGSEVKMAVDQTLPRQLLRAPLLSGDSFRPSPFLVVENTHKGYGVWWVRKEFWTRVGVVGDNGVQRVETCEDQGSGI